ncbi:hypothetical protein Strain138_002238 [Pseudogemmatithrix spongiicola]|uniref:Uncharacterized protein n=1 Tax=Pseudogemmatithrix spongiicola TaxID=3062599 RepID=A0AA49K185_9BACT|nr:hypothetical protein Strain138_002238 [Gemmatimonadaceae bacterium 'strain 138']WKW15834.1 hypothetical protein Strain318_002237 [Gemmatimonadaceae bacterium 'strain 318']
MRRALWFLGLACLLVLPARSAAQEATPRVQADSVTEVRLRDGSVLVGRIERETDATIVLMTVGGVRTEIPRAQVISMRRVTLRPGGQVWPDDENVSRLFFTSTGRSLPRGQGYVSAYWVLFPFIGYGVTDRFTIAGGTPIVPGGIGEIVYLAPKFKIFDAERVDVSVGTLSFWYTPEADRGNLGILYGVGTYGTSDAAVTFGAGWFYANVEDDLETSNEPVFMLGGERRVSRRVKLITENWFAVNPGVSGLLSGGFRFVGDRLSADFAFAGATGVEAACCLPMVNFVWTFGSRR